MKKLEGAVIYFTRSGGCKAKKVMEILSNFGYSMKLIGSGDSPSEWIKNNFRNTALLVFVGAAGIAVRMTAPYLSSKLTDPAVIVMDESGKFVIPILSGHVGGANKTAEYIAEKTGAEAVITTATDVRGKFAVDSWAVENGLCIINPEMIKTISMNVLEDKEIFIKSDIPLVIENRQLKEGECGDTGISISWYKKNYFRKELKLVPVSIYAGIGCRKGTSADAIEKAIDTVMMSEGIFSEALVAIASVDIKQHEKGLIEFAEKRSIEFNTYTAEELMNAEGNFSTSEFVKKVTGADNVCERAAVCASGYGRLILARRVCEGITVALAAREETLYVK